jgi:uncharacterized protein YacL
MEEQINQTPEGIKKQDLPNHIGVLVLGIISIALCWCYGIVSLILGIISIVMASKAEQLYKESPETYSEGSVKNLKAGKICAIIGLSLSAVYLIFIVIYLLFIGTLISSVPWQMYN